MMACIATLSSAGEGLQSEELRGMLQDSLPQSTDSYKTEVFYQWRRHCCSNESRAEGIVKGGERSSSEGSTASNSHPSQSCLGYEGRSGSSLGEDESDLQVNKPTCVHKHNLTAYVQVAEESTDFGGQ